MLMPGLSFRVMMWTYVWVYVAVLLHWCGWSACAALKETTASYVTFIFSTHFCPHTNTHI